MEYVLSQDLPCDIAIIRIGTDMSIILVTTLLLHRNIDLDISSHLPNILAQHVYPHTLTTLPYYIPFSLSPSNPRHDWSASLARDTIFAAQRAMLPVIVGTGRASQQEYEKVMAETVAELEACEGRAGVVVVFGRKL